MLRDSRRLAESSDKALVRKGTISADKGINQPARPSLYIPVGGRSVHPAPKTGECTGHRFDLDQRCGLLLITNPTPTIGFVQAGLTASASSATSLNQCHNNTRTSINTLTFTGDFGTAFKTRVAAQSNMPAGARLFVSTTNVQNNALPTFPTNPLAASGNNTGQTTYVQLVTSETVSDGNLSWILPRHRQRGRLVGQPVTIVATVAAPT